MSPEEINQAIAEWMGPSQFVGLKKQDLWYRPKAAGYTSCEKEAGRYTREEAKKHEYLHGEDQVHIVEFSQPDYYNDLNAVHEAVLSLPKENWGKFTMELRAIIVRDCNTEEHYVLDCERNIIADIWFYNATAPQRCEALLKTIGKWKSNEQQSKSRDRTHS